MGSVRNGLHVIVLLAKDATWKTSHNLRSPHTDGKALSLKTTPTQNIEYRESELGLPSAFTPAD